MIHHRPAPLPPGDYATCGRTAQGAPIPLPFVPEPGLPCDGQGRLERAQAAWQAHLDAGRIGVAAPPAPAGAERGCASLAAILRRGRRGQLW